MGNIYNIGEVIKADGDNYRVLGRITYLNKADGKTWDEYRLRAENFNNEERWLSVDYAYNEYSLSKKNPFANTMGYHLVDRGTAQVAGVAGDVDVEMGEEVIFEEYEDVTEEKIVSIEHWNDEDEYSSGYYLDPWEFGRGSQNSCFRKRFNRPDQQDNSNSNICSGLLWLIAKRADTSEFKNRVIS